MSDAAVNSAPAAPSGLRLHLGCGADRWEGWLNIDLAPGPAVDQVMDIRDLPGPFAPGSCRAIHLMHAINYLTLWEARAFLRTCHALLEPGGELVIETADAAKAAQRFLEAMGRDPEAYLEGIRAFPGFGLDHLTEQRAYTANAMAWTPWHLERELRDAGFPTTRFAESRTHAGWRDFRMEAVKDAPVSSPTTVRHVLFVVDEDAGHVTVHLRARMFVEPLARRGITSEVLDAGRASAADIASAAARADVVLMTKVPSLSLLRTVRDATTAPVLFDFTDALWLPHHQQHGWQDLHALLAESDALLCDNAEIAAYGRRHNPRVHLWPASTRVELFDAARAARTSTDNPTSRGLRLGWVGSQGTATAIHRVAEALAAVARQVPQLELRVLGCDASALPEIPGVRVSVRADYDEAAMIEELVAFDIGLFPAPNSLEDYRNRGPLKGALYMSAGVPMVCQRGGELDAVVVQGVSGFTADGDAEWTRHLLTLCTDGALRASMGQAARAAMSGRTLDAIADRLVEILAAEVATPRTARSRPAPLPARKPRILVQADVPGWIFERHARVLQSRLAQDFDIEIGFHGQSIDEARYDLIYPLEYNLLSPELIGAPWKYVTGLRSHISWDGVPPALLSRYLARHYQRTHVVSARLQQLFAPHMPTVAYVTHGIDTERFVPRVRRRAPGQPLRVGWAGNRKSPAKGYEEFIAPLAAIDGVELVIRGYSDRNLPLEAMPDFYAGLDVYVCTSSTEGNNNSLLEAAATGCAIVTTDTGTVPEYLADGVGALIVPRTAEAFRDAVVRLRDDAVLRANMGAAAADAVHPAWSWSVRIEDYRRFLREALDAREGAEARMRKGTGARPMADTLAAALDALQRALQAGNMGAARSAAERLVTLNPTNAEFRTVYRELHHA